MVSGILITRIHSFTTLVTGRSQHSHNPSFPRVFSFGVTGAHSIIIMQKLIVLVVLLFACGDNVSHIQRAEACAEEADMWCAHLGYPTWGCEHNYMSHCAPGGGTDSYIETSAHEECLAAIAIAGDHEPRECAIVWGSVNKP